jgi:DNA primase
VLFRSAGADHAARAQAIEQLGPVLAAVESPVEVQLYVERVAQAFQIADLGAVRQQLRRGVMAARAQDRPARGRADDRGAGPGRGPSGTGEGRGPEPGRGEASPPPRREKPAELSQIPGVERDLVGCLLDQPEAFDDAVAEKIPELLTSREMEAIFRAALRLASVHGTVDASSLLAEVEKDGVGDGPARRWLEERLAIQTFDAASAKSFVETAMPLLRKQQIEREQRELMRRIQEALREGNQELAAELMKLRDALFRAGGALLSRR